MSTAVVNLDSTIVRRIGPPPLTSAVTSWNGLTGAVKGTLAEIWAFGAADSALLDNRFAFPSGNLRFVGSTGTLALPAAGFFESATTPGDPRIGSDYHRRFFQTGVGIGGTTFAQFEGFNPAWDGTFRGIGGLQSISQRVTFTNGTSPQTGPTPGMELGQETWWNIFGFFDGTDYWPLLDSNDGAREDVRWDLFNEATATTVTRGQLTGWGTWLGMPLLLRHGTTAAFDTQAHFAIAGGTAAGDGIGWFVRNGTDDPPYGIARWFWQGNGSASGWEFLASNTPGTLQSLLKMDPIAGAVFGVPLSLPATQQGVQAAYHTGLLDFTAAADGIAIPIPQQAGFIFCPRLLTTLVHDGAGTATGALVWSAGNNAAHNNTAQTSISAGSLNALIAIAPQPAFANGGGTSALLDSATQIVVKISTGVTGVTSLHGYISISGFWVQA